MTVPEIQERFNQASKALAEQFPSLVQKIAVNAKAKVELRIQDSGLDSKGAKLPGYSTAEIPFFFYKNGKLMAPYSQSTNSKVLAKKKLTKAQRANLELLGSESGETDLRPTLSYKEYRELNNLPTDHVDLTFTGDMWRALQIVETKVEGTKYVVVIGGVRESEQKKIDYNSERYGDILQPSESEISDLQDSYEEEVVKIIKEFL